LTDHLVQNLVCVGRVGGVGSVDIVGMILMSVSVRERGRRGISWCLCCAFIVGVLKFDVFSVAGLCPRGVSDGRE
jgi:hypothetical protein